MAPSSNQSPLAALRTSASTNPVTWLKNALEELAGIAAFVVLGPVLAYISMPVRPASWHGPAIKVWLGAWFVAYAGTLRWYVYLAVPVGLLIATALWIFHWHQDIARRIAVGSGIAAILVTVIAAWLAPALTSQAGIS